MLNNSAENSGERSFAFPTDRQQIVPLARETSERLITDPTLVPPFLFSSESALLVRRASQGTESARLLEEYLARMIRETKNGWERRSKLPFTLEAAKALLHSFKKGPNKSPQAGITDNIIKGYLNDRFDRGSVCDWRGSLRTHKTLFEATLSPTPDAHLIENWFDTVTNSNSSPLPRYSLGARALGLSRYIADPTDQEYISIGSTLFRGITMAAVLLGRQEEVHSSFIDHLSYIIPVAFASVVVEQGLDPFKGNGERMYRRIFQEFKKNPEAIRSRLPGAYKDINFMAALRFNLTSDAVEMARQRIRYPETGDRVYKAMGALTERFINSRLPLTPFLVFPRGINPKEIYEDDGSMKFPFNSFFEPNPDLEKIYNLFSTDTKEKVINNYLVSMKENRDPSWQVTSVETPKVLGYLLTPEPFSKDPNEQRKQVEEFLKQEELYEAYRKFMDRHPDTKLPFGMQRENYSVLLYAPDLFVDPTALEKLLTLKIPTELMDRALETLRKNLERRRELPSRFSRMPTFVGDQYSLGDHSDLPNVIRRALIQKSEQGGLRYQLSFYGDENLYPKNYTPSISGEFNFQYGCVNIVPEENTPILPAGIKWILDSAILSLIEKSCCPPINEIEEPEYPTFFEKPSRHSIPGYIGHVGGFRRDGTRKQFTPGASERFEEVIRSLSRDTSGRDTGGISLAVVNERHKQDHIREGSWDDRYLTYYRGRDTNYPQLPVERSRPQRLIIIS